MGKDRQSLEITAQDCKLRKKVASKWTTMEHSTHLYLPEGGDYVSGINLTRLAGNITFDKDVRTTMRKGEKARWDAKFLMNTKRGVQAVATVQLRCFPGKHMDIQVVRERMSDASFIHGQLGQHAVHISKIKNDRVTRSRRHRTKSSRLPRVGRTWVAAVMRPPTLIKWIGTELRWDLPLPVLLKGRRRPSRFVWRGWGKPAMLTKTSWRTASRMCALAMRQRLSLRRIFFPTESSLGAEQPQQGLVP